MKYSTVLVASLPFVHALPQTAQKAAVACKVLAADPTWPSEADWKQHLPNAVARGPQKALLHPDYRLEAKSTDDVVNAVKFAAKHNVRLSVITSGHDGLARNDAPSGLLVGLGSLGGVRLEQTYTATSQGLPKIAAAAAPAVPPPMATTSIAPMAAMPSMTGMSGMKRSPHGPDGDNPMPAPKNPPASPPAPVVPVAPKGGKLPYAVTFGAGVTTQQMNNIIAKDGIFTNGAEHGEVGVAGGWTQCGGHGPMSSAYGLGVDSVLEFQVVTADGQLKVANAVANPDLFWALRGGCGSTYGIVTQATVRAYPSPKMTVTKFTLNATNPDGLFEPMAYLHSQMPSLSEKGVQGYYIVFPTQFIGIFHTVGNLANVESAKKIWDPVLEKIATYSGIANASTKATYLDYPNYKAYFDATWGAAEADEMKKRDVNEEPILDWWTGKYVTRNSLARRHGPGEAKALASSMGKMGGDGRLLTKEALQSPQLAAALKEAMPNKPGKMLRGALVGGGAVFKPSITETSVHPSFRKMYVGFWSDKNVDAVAKLDKTMGAYPNEASYNETNWQDVFWGSNYPKLSQLKTKYDPDTLFYVTPGINAEMMAMNDKGALCRSATVNKQSVFPPMGDNRNVRSG